MEAHIDSGGGGYWFAVERAGAERPLHDRFDGLFVEAHSHALDDVCIDHLAGGVDLDIDHHLALKPGFAGLVRVFRIFLVNHFRVRHAAAAGRVYAEAVAGSGAASIAGTHASAFTAADAAARASAV